MQVGIDKTLKSLQVVTHHIYNLGPGILSLFVLSFLSVFCLQSSVFLCVIYRSFYPENES